MDKGKELYVRIKKKCQSDQCSLNGKLVLKKMAAVWRKSAKVTSSTTSSDSSFEEDLNKSKDRYSSESLREKRNYRAFRKEDSDQNQSQALREEDKDPNYLLKPKVRPIVDLEGNILSLPLNGPIQLQLRDFKEIATEALNKLRLNWDLEDEIAKVIERGVAMDCFNNSEGKKADEVRKVKKDIVFCNVYAASADSERRDFILTLLQTFTASWCVGGDFNTVLDPSERIGVSLNLESIRSFASFIAQANIVDIPLHGLSLTWSNNKLRKSWARLDRFLLSLTILGWFPNMFQRGLP
ncbi:hypothetical protein Ddye_025535 [Dipteronia dyeriana]|uniref:Endonuclease/exonuclease/phosphatase domain-containing protein n=1 Tax=Dipteronia dyeriana TaxID=168575 RepID=A0AAD9WPP2_9ROSI|nr:hypothetical protein Ddye_025535 [Dipteronia dyeriana]